LGKVQLKLQLQFNDPKYRLATIILEEQLSPAKQGQAQRPALLESVNWERWLISLKAHRLISKFYKKDRFLARANPGS
jgi:hypothetical protein